MSAVPTPIIKSQEDLNLYWNKTVPNSFKMADQLDDRVKSPPKGGLSFPILISPSNIVGVENAPADEDISEALAPTHPKGRFNIWARYYILTYKYHLNKELVVNWFTKLAAERKMYDIIVRVSHESGSKKVPYLHSHVFVDFGRQFKSENARVFDHCFVLWCPPGHEIPGLGIHSDQPHPNIGGICKRMHLNRIYKYMCKEDHSNDDMLDWILKDHLVEDYWEHDNVQDALRMANRPSDIPGILAAYAHRPQPTAELEMFQFAWQLELFEMCRTCSFKREIHWVFDSKGGMGKSDFVRQAAQRLGKKCLVFTQFGGARDAATVVANHLESGGTGEVVLIDLPRGAEDKSIYEPIEMIKNGLITTIKYNGHTVRFTNKVLIVFANFLPKFGAVTPTRWRIWNRSHHEEYFAYDDDEYPDDWDEKIPPWEYAEKYAFQWEDGTLEFSEGLHSYPDLDIYTADELVELSNRINSRLALNRRLS